MSDTELRDHLRTQLDDLKEKGLYKRERRIETPQGPAIRVDGREVVNFCANNYLGLANHPDIVAAAHEGLKTWGYGLSQRPLHLRHAGRAQAARSGRSPSSSARTTRSSTSPASTPTAGCSSRCSSEEDAILSRRAEPRQHHRRRAALQGAAVPLQAQRHGRPEGQAGGGEGLPVQDDLHRQRLQHGRRPGEAAGHLRPGRPVRRGRRDRRLPRAPGTSGPTGRGAAEELGVLDRIDVITSTLGKTLGGASGGFTAARAEVVDWLRNRSRPYLFSNSVPPALVAAAMKALELVDRSGELRDEAEGEHEADAGRAGGGRVHDQARADADPAGDARRRGAWRRRWPTSCWSTAST